MKIDACDAQCVGLSYIWLAYNDSDDDLYLDELSVKNNGINKQWAVRLNFKLCQPIKAKKIDLSDNNLGDKAAKELQTYFLKNPYIEVLNLSNIGI